MQIETLPFSGHYEEEPRPVAETLEVVMPEQELEEDVIGWAVLRHGETLIDEDSARPGYLFQYRLGDYMQRGLYRLTLTARDRSRHEWHAEIAAALVATIAPETEARRRGFVPMWFISERLHFATPEANIRRHYPGETFGRLLFDRTEGLPHRRLFRATAA